MLWVAILSYEAVRPHLTESKGGGRCTAVRMLGLLVILHLAFLELAGLIKISGQQ